MFLRFKQSICVSVGSNANLMVRTLMQTWGKCWGNVMTGRAMRLQVRATGKQSFQRKLLGLQKMSEVIKEIAVFRRIPSNLTHEKYDILWNDGFMASLKAQRSCAFHRTHRVWKRPTCVLLDGLGFSDFLKRAVRIWLGCMRTVWELGLGLLVLTVSIWPITR